MKLEKVKAKPKYQIKRKISYENNVWGALKALDITESVIDKGLIHLKQIAKSSFRRKVKISHPDMPFNGGAPSKGRNFNTQLTAYKKIMALKCVPMTMMNTNKVLEIGKGYVSTNDVDLPWELWG